MKIRVQQLNPIIGDIDGNLAAIKKAIESAEIAKADLLLVPELVTCGYSPMDLLERPDFLKAIFEVNEQIVDYAKETAIIFGTVTPNKSEVGRKIFNSAVFAHEGKIKAEIHKTLLPTYDVYDELRYFEPNQSFECVAFKGRKLGITICEDIWGNFGESPAVVYDLNPAQKLADLGAEAIFNLSASPYTKNKPDTRKRMLQEQIKNIKRPVFYANQVGGNSELVSDGDSMVMDSNEKIVARAPLFREAFVDVEWNQPNNFNKAGTDSLETPPVTEQVFRALVLGLHDYLRKSELGKKVIIGLSGGIDSALAACIAVEALGAENVTAVAMPSEFSSEESVTDAQKLADNLQISFHQFSIESLYEKYLTTLKPLFKNTGFGVAEENIQARARGMLLMAISNKCGGLVLNTGNKSELAVGYCTLYGDMNGALGVISDLYKTEVLELAKWLNEHLYDKEIIPQSIIKKPPSAELRPEQKDADSLPDYEKLDAILKLYIEEDKSFHKIVQKGFEKHTVSKIIRWVNQSEYKRYQAAPGLKISEKAFGSGRRRPLVYGKSFQY